MILCEPKAASREASPSLAPKCSHHPCLATAARGAAGARHTRATRPSARSRAFGLTVAALAFEAPAMTSRSQSAIGRFGADS